MADLSSLNRKRTAVKGWLSRCLKKAEEALEQQAEVELLSEIRKELESRLAQYDELQSEIELLFETEEDMMQDIEKAGLYRDSVTSVLMKVRKASLRAEDNDAQSVTSQCAVRLPKLELPKFGGQVLEWTQFWDQFEAAVDASDLPDVSKLVYLKSLLTGEAKKAIEGLAVVKENYKVACEVLKGRYARPSKIIFAHVEKLLKLGLKDGRDLKSVQDALLVHVRSLERLGISGETYGVILTPLILSRLPDTFRLEWARGSEGKESDLTHLLSCLESEINRLERSALGGGTELNLNVPETRSRERRAGPPPVSASSRAASTRRSQPGRTSSRWGPPEAPAVPSGAALQSSSSTRCGFCSGSHKTDTCRDFLELDISARQKRVRDAGLCFVCFSGDHRARYCLERCTYCKGRHNILCCYKHLINSAHKSVTHDVKQSVSDHVPPVKETDAASLSTLPPKQCSVLPTARVMVESGNGAAVEATLVFDTGSDRSYISQSLVQKVGPEWIGSDKSTYCAFGGGKSTTCDRNIYEVKVKGANTVRSEFFRLKATEVPVICAPMQRPQVSKEALRLFAGVDLADGRFSSDHSLSVDLLIGLDQYWSLLKDGMIRTSAGLVAQETVFGWIVSGSVTGKMAQSQSIQLLLLNDVPDKIFRDLWELEPIGVHQGDDVDDPVLADFHSSLSKKEGRYEVALPWKKEGPTLLDNFDSARARLSGLTRKFDTDTELRDEYDSVLQEWEQSGLIEEVPETERDVPPDSDTFYMPHRPVLRPESVSTKVRPVFDASACGPNGVSLNECLEAGPSLIPNLTDVLLRFRRHKFAVTGDISRAFLQISVRREDRNVLRFLWEFDGRVRVMRFCRVPFGVTSSPFLLNATLKHHLSLYPQSKVVTELQNNLYVDDWLTGADTEQEAGEMFIEGRDILSQAGMVLSKCHSNSNLVLDRASSPREDRDESLKILGVGWDPVDDMLKYDGVSLPSDIVPTKRVVLSFLARTFDPLGFLVPFVMVLKILFQQLWLLGLSWDDPIPSEQADVFQKWLEGVPQLQQLRIPRCYAEASVSWSDMPGLELHVFGDASTKGYGSVVYLRYMLPSGEFAVTFVMSRARVAPVKTVTLPRLELMACLIAARLVVHVRKALQLSDEVPVFCWTDSTVALAWVQSSPSKWKPFVRNRVVEVQSLTSPSDWRHTKGVDNPADAASRGMFAGQLIGSELWLHGPEWLHETLDQSDDCGLFVTSEELAEPPEEGPAMMSVSGAAASLFDAERWGSLGKAVRVVAYVRRFISNCRSPSHKEQSDLTADELADARTALLRDVQRVAYQEELKALRGGKPLPKSSSIRDLTPFVGSDGLIRIQGRLQLSDLAYEAKHPILLPKGRVSELLVSEQHLLMSHAGVSTLITAIRGAYWIVGLRCLARRVKRCCVSCKRQDAPSCGEPAAPLPESRVTQSPPFSVTGVDHAGPVFCVDFPGKKFYITLFTCAVTRAVHLELVDSLSQEQFIFAFRRFAARRGMPSVVYSDNARTFKSADALLQNYFGHLAPRWKLIVPRSAWWGGWWERLIKSCKAGLRKSLGARSLTRTELETVLFDIEACVNSRPLTFVGDKVDCANPLTPSHFLLGRGAGFQGKVVEDPEAVSPKMLPERARVCERRLNRFWSVWTTEYLRNLPPSVRKFSSRGKLVVGSVVLIREDNTPRMKWVTGVVTKLYPGRDGVTRSAQVHTSKGLRTRAIQRLHDLELGPDPSDM